MSLETDKNRNVWRYPDVPHLEGLFPFYLIQLIKRNWAQSRPLPQGLLFPELLLEARLPNWSPRVASRLLPWTVPKGAFTCACYQHKSLEWIHPLEAAQGFACYLLWTPGVLPSMLLVYGSLCSVLSQYLTVSFVYPVYFTRFQRGTSKGSH